MKQIALMVGLLLFCSVTRGEELSILAPTSYAGFQTVESYGSFEIAVTKGSLLILKGSIKAKNPIIIDTAAPLVIHGTLGASITLTDPSQPLFVVKNCPYFNLTRISLDSGAMAALATSSKGNISLLSFQNIWPVRADLLQVSFNSGLVDISGPGQFVFQNVKSFTNGLTYAEVVVNHPQAEFYWIGAHNGMSGNTTALTGEDIHHVWQKQGHVEIYGTLPTSGRGRGDYRFDSPSQKGCHFVAGVRSEGNNYGATDPSSKLSRLIYVPPSSGKVNVCVKASYLMEPVPTTFCEYNGTGTLWLIGNKCGGQTNVVEGTAPGATICLYGNSLDTSSTLTNVQGANVVEVGNRAKSGSSIPFVSNNTFTTFKNVPEPPRIVSLPLVGCPSVDSSQIVTLSLTSVKSFGAVGDGLTDDTAAIQKAFDVAGQSLFFPSGTYLITQPIVFKPTTTGWIAGAGANTTRIKNISDDSVMWCQSLAGYVIQGLTFESSGQSQPNFISEKITSQNTFTTFYDCCFNGGLYGLSIANFLNNGNCEQIMIARCRFDSCYQGLSVGYANSLGVLVRDCDFQDNSIAYRIGGSWTDSWQGQFHVLGARVRGTKLFETEPNKQHNTYLWNVQSDSKVIYNSGSSTYLMFDNCEYNGGMVGVPMLTNPGTPGPIFLHSKVPAGLLYYPTTAQGYAFKLYSSIGDWTLSKSKIGQNVKFFDSADSITDPVPSLPTLGQTLGVTLSSDLVFRKVIVQGPRCTNAGTLDRIPKQFLGSYSIVSMRGDYTKPGVGYSITLNSSKWVYLFVMLRGKTVIPDGWQKLYENSNWSGNTDLIYSKQVQSGTLVVPPHIGTADGINYGVPHMLVISDTDISPFVPNPLVEPVTDSILLGKGNLNGPRTSDAYMVLDYPTELAGLDCLLMPRGLYTTPGAGYTFNAKQNCFVYLSVNEKGAATLDPSWTRLDRNLVWGSAGLAYLDNFYVKQFPIGPVVIPPNASGVVGNYGLPNLAIVATTRVMDNNPNDLLQLVGGSALHTTMKVSGPRVVSQYTFRTVPTKMIGAECLVPLGSAPSATVPTIGFSVKVLQDCYVYLGVADQSITTGTPTIPIGWVKKTVFRTGWASASSDSIYVRQAKAGDIIEIPANDSKIGGANYAPPSFCVGSVNDLFQ